ncbi:DUF3105 domain-containing protein [Nocardiopsis rhodophaea]|uniref:DUF3105 domain-containing protein n=1 Tax=Nocardiopsis rhodophaea TaxID=280238 RepID=A0ABN2T6C8_9ACTN
MSKKSAAERRRRAAEMRAQRQRQERRRTIAIGTGVALTGVLVLGAIGFGAYNAWNRRNIEGLESFDVGRGHVAASVDYEQNPPAGGEHNPAWQDCAVYTEPIVNEFGVHSLEHGAVWITYQPDLDPEQVEKLEARHTPGSYVLVSPYQDDLPAPVVASAWGKQIQLDNADDDRLDKFLRTYEQHPGVPEPGAACSGAVSFTAKQFEEQGGFEKLDVGGMDDPTG